MRDLVSTIVPCAVDVDGRRYYVDRPTVEQALTVVAACEAVADGDTEAWSDVLATLRREFSN